MIAVLWQSLYEYTIMRDAVPMGGLVRYENSMDSTQVMDSQLAQFEKQQAMWQVRFNLYVLANGGCSPCHAEKKWADSAAAKGDEEKKEVNFVLDAVGLYAEELQLSATECARKRNIFWLGLGNDDETRTKVFDKLSEARMKGDVRAYQFDADKEMLSPPSEKRFCPTTTQDSLAHEHANEPEHEQDEDIESVKSI
ncbi:unnamed protein product [Cylicocyclus nassatus]|uniref:Uncharacterized protein n=1 Tax=Cylicocyclus nassatus TaxID=53992 RepID=A0AA36MHQ3_CYLNA|nr:unnamed protein product [Cylicocyclus nassatus]